MNVTLEKLKSMLGNEKNVAVSMFARTKPKLIKGNPFGTRLEKIVLVTGFIGSELHYQNLVNTARSQEGLKTNFVARKRAWGVREANSPFVIHKEKHYLEVFVNGCMGLSYEMSGQTVDFEVVKPWLAPKKEGGRQGLTKPVIIRDFALENIKEIFIGKKFLKVS